MLTARDLIRINTSSALHCRAVTAHTLCKHASSLHHASSRTTDTPDGTAHTDLLLKPRTVVSTDMSFTPKTPASSGGGATNVAEGSRTKPTPHTAAHLMTMTGEPSPASTYGETVVGGDSVPATPLSANGTGE